MTEFRYFSTYSGVHLPLQLVGPLEDDDIRHRNTFMRARFDGERIVLCEKMTYGEVELSHRYDYHASGALRRAEITQDEDVTVLEYDEDGRRRP